MVGARIKGSQIGGCCKDCQERFPACHDVCATYLAAKAEWNEKQELIREAKQKVKLIDGYHFEQIQKVRKIMREKKGSRR